MLNLNYHACIYYGFSILKLFIENMCLVCGYFKFEFVVALWFECDISLPDFYLLFDDLKKNTISIPCSIYYLNLSEIDKICIQILHLLGVFQLVIY